MNEAITDIWFFSDVELPELTDHLELTELVCDSGADWSWASGKLLDFKLDIVRRCPAPSQPGQTRIFLFEKELPFSAGFIHHLVVRLRELGIAPIYCGSWLPDEQGGFKQQIVNVET